MKAITTLFLLLFSFNCFSTEINCSYDNGWKKMVVDLEEKVFKLQIWSTGEEEYKDSAIFKDVLVETSKGSVVIYEGSEKSRVLGEIVHVEDRQIKLSSILYKNEWFTTSLHENLDEIFDL